MLSFKQFKVLEALEKSAGPVPQRKLAGQLGFSVGTVNRTLSDLAQLGFVRAGEMTEAGLLALEPFRVKRAVFVAAGFGSRLVPITLNTPKPLVRVKGRMIIDTLLAAVVQAGIEEIYIVRGYLGEQFDQLLSKYPMIRFIENPLYNEGNNILSILCAGDKVQNAYILEADLYLENPALITKYQYATNYLAIPVQKTDDWCFVTENGIIKKVLIGGVDCEQMVGISYWTEEDGRKLQTDVRQAADAPGGKERYWDNVPLTYYADRYKVHTRLCAASDVVEIDTFAELKQIDPAYHT